MTKLAYTIKVSNVAYVEITRRGFLAAIIRRLAKLEFGSTAAFWEHLVGRQLIDPKEIHKTRFVNALAFNLAGSSGVIDKTISAGLDYFNITKEDVESMAAKLRPTENLTYKMNVSGAINDNIRTIIYSNYFIEMIGQYHTENFPKPDRLELSEGLRSFDRIAAVDVASDKAVRLSGGGASIILSNKVIMSTTGLSAEDMKNVSHVILSCDGKITSIIYKISEVQNGSSIT